MPSLVSTHRPSFGNLNADYIYCIYIHRLKNKHKRGFPLWHSEVNPTSVPESGDSIPGLAPWVESPEFP